MNGVRRGLERRAERKQGLEIVVGVTTAAPKQTIVSAFALCAAAFVMANLAAAWRLNDVSSQSKAIWQDAMPAVVTLTRLRERLGALLSDLSVGAEDGQRTPPQLDLTLADIAEEEATYDGRGSESRRDDAWMRARAALDGAEAAASCRLISGHPIELC